MDVPAAVESELDGENVAVRVPLKGEDALFVTPTQTLVYRGEGLLSDESVASYPHSAERVEVSEGRRKTTITLDYGLEGVEEFTVRTSKVDDVLRPLLAGVLSAAGVTEPGETVKETYHFSELTLVVTSDRLVKHVGTAVWDQDYEEIHFETVRDLEVEEGNVASQLVLTTDRRTERIKAPNDQFRAVRESVEDALFGFYDVDTYESFRRAVGADEEEEAAEASEPSGRTGEDFQTTELDTIETSGGGDETRDRDDEHADAVDASADETAGESVAESAAGSAGERSVESTSSEAETETVEPTDTGSIESGLTESIPEAEPELDEEPPLDREVVRAELEALHETVERQQELLERQHEQIEALLELTRDR